MNAHSSRSSGFTLIEMIITLSVFLLLAGAIFSIFGATLESASTLQDNQNREDTAQALENWVRQSLLDLPSDGVLVSSRRGDRTIGGVIWGAGNELQALDFHPQANGNYLLRLTTYRAVSLPGSEDLAGPAASAAALEKFQVQLSTGDPELSWRPLVRDVKSANWRFRMGSGGVWSDDSPGRPLVAELAFLPAGQPAAIVVDFWVPPLQSPDYPALPVAAPAVTINP